EEDLRRLMREKQREKLRSPAAVTKRIDSPLARYNSLGHLYCVVCNIPIKSELLWQTHVLGKLHKENIADAKQNSTTPTVAQLPQKRKQPNDRLSEVNLDLQMMCNTCAPNLDALLLSGKSFDKSAAAPPLSKKSLLIAVEECKGEEGSTPTSNNTNSTASSLPGGKYRVPSHLNSTRHALNRNHYAPCSFHSGAAAPPPPVSHSGTITKAGETEVKAEKPKENTVEALPEGFFDDPVMDAKVRKVNLPKEQMEKEWEEFQKEMRQQTMVSEALQAEDDEEVRVERQIKEIDEQIECYRRVEMLLNKRHSLKEKLKDTLADRDQVDEEDDDEEELRNFLSGDWRAKGTWL
uniref:Zinc finger protein 830 n=1 Tax=Petromyzon marinus TaxID=7757 RepID=S4RHF5_PETMA